MSLRASAPQGAVRECFYAPAATMLPSSGEEPFAASARGVALQIANHIAAVPMLRERIEVLEAALAAAECAHKEAQWDKELLLEAAKACVDSASENEYDYSARLDEDVYTALKKAIKAVAS